MMWSPNTFELSWDKSPFYNPKKIHIRLKYQTNSFVEEENLVVNEQNAFRQNRSCIDHIFALHNILRIL